MNLMRQPLLPLLLQLAWLTLVTPAGADEAEMPTSTMLTMHERLVASIQAQPIGTLEEVYLRCARASEQRMLGGDEAGFCSIASEVLMKRRFGGDFEAMLAWWRTHRLR